MKMDDGKNCYKYEEIVYSSWPSTSSLGTSPPALFVAQASSTSGHMDFFLNIQ